MGTNKAATGGTASIATGCQESCAGWAAEEKKLAVEEKEGGTCDEPHYRSSGVRHVDD